jgi:hypothetical protein
MEIAFLIIAVIGLLALTGGGNVSANIQPNYVTANPPPDPWTPTASSPYQPPMLPSTGANVSGQLFQGAASAGTSIASAAGKSLALGGIATAGIAAGVGIAIGVAASLYAAHKARLQGASTFQWSIVS